MEEKNLKETCEFASILDEFKRELTCMGENSDVIYSKINIIKDVREPKEEKTSTADAANDIISDLWACLEMMKLYNLKLSESKKALIKFVG